LRTLPEVGSMTIDRRTLIKALGAIALGARPSEGGAQADGTLSPAQFGNVSSALAGYAPSQPGDVARVFANFATPDERAALARLARLVADTPSADLTAALRSGGLEPVANELVSAWYSGIVGQGKQAKLVLYADAFVWSAMTFSKPMGICGGVTGYWTNPP
jgi:hypothetical protein